MKCKGVMGAVMAIKHLAGKPETCDQAFELFSMFISLRLKYLISNNMYDIKFLLQIK